MPAIRKNLLRKAARKLPWFLFLGAVLALMATPASANIELIYFRASAEPASVFLQWETATELDNSAFIVRRNQIGGTNPASYSQIPVIDADTGEEFTVIPARGDGVTGAYYPFYDENVNIGTRYYYLLEDIDTGNVSHYNGPVEVVAGQTPTPGPSPTNTSSPTSTHTPTSQSITNTPSPTSQSATSTATQGSTNPTATQSGYPAPTQQSGYPVLSPTVSPTLDPNVTPVNATLTAIAEAVTALATESTTGTPDAVAQAASETPAGATATPVEAESSATPAAEQEGPENAALNRLILLGVIFLASGLLLTGGIIYLARMNQDQA